MSSLIICALALALVQIWLLPAVFNVKNIAYLLSSRDDALETTAVQQRIERASQNLQESLPAFLALCLLAMHLEIDISTTATYWIILRSLYVPLYMVGIPYVRSLVWAASLVCLVQIAFQLV